jgi:hypothetical protein
LVNKSNLQKEKHFAHQKSVTTTTIFFGTPKKKIPSSAPNLSYLPFIAPRPADPFCPVIRIPEKKIATPKLRAGIQSKKQQRERKKEEKQG